MHNHRSAYRLWLTLSITMLLVLGLIPSTAPTPAIAQENLLQNPGFEPPFNPVGGSSTVQVAVGWQPWHIPALAGSSSAENLQPDFQPAREERIRSGSGAQEYNTFFATHEGGVFQRVPVTLGSELEFSVFAYLYSSSDFDDPDNSTNPQGLRISVGIDPAGETNGQSPNIVWSTPQEYYDEYRQQSVKTVAAANSVTVWVRSTVDNAAGLHQVFLDDAQLVIVGEGTPPTVVTTNPTTETPITPIVTETTPVVTPPTTPVVTTPVVTTPPVPTVVRTPISAEFPNEVAYTVQGGDTVIGIATRFGSTSNAIIDYNGLDASGLIFVNQTLLIPVPIGQGTPINQPPAQNPTPPFGQGGSVVEGGVYVVQAGDNLFRIALRFNTTVETLAQFNGVLNPAQIFVGQQIRIPSATAPTAAQPVPAQPIAPAVPATGGITTGSRIHIVQAGENMFRIGLKYNITWDRIAVANGLVNPNLIFVGQQLIIP